MPHLTWRGSRPSPARTAAGAPESPSGSGGAVVVRRHRWLILAVLVLVALTVALAAGASNSSASLKCSGTSIKINGGKGAEAPSTAWGHKHDSGNHYARYIYSSGEHEYWSDNNGGWDGDTRDTLHGTIDCW